VTSAAKQNLSASVRLIVSVSAPAVIVLGIENNALQNP
jgi:hypothetical protein